MNVWIRNVLALLALGAGQVFAQTTVHEVYLDLDADPATGCSVTTPAGVVTGAEVRVSASVAGTPAQVQSITRANCAGTVFGAAQSQPAGYPVGLNLGNGGADVVEIATALAGLGEGGPARLTVVAANATGADLVQASIVLPGGVQPPVAAPAPAIIPATGWLALLLLAGLAVWLVRRHPNFGSTMAVMLLLGAGVAWAANYVADGQVFDWSGESPVALDPANDASDGSAEIDILALFAATEAGNLYVRVDIRDLEPSANVAPTLADASLAVDENAAANTPVGTVTGSDTDAGQTLSYAITAGNTGNTFAIDASTGAITVAVPALLDYESTPVFNFTVTVTDSGTPALSDSATVTVSLNDVNEAPLIADQSYAVAENTPNGTAVAAVVASDPDGTAPNATLVYAITAGNTDNAFAIDAATGAISVANVTAITLANAPFVLTVSVTDGGTPALSASATVNIDVTDQNDAPVFGQAAYTLAVDENSSNGTDLGSVSATDPDAGQTATLVYAIASGNIGGAFAIDAGTGAITVADSTVLDFETTPQFILTVSATDTGTPPLSSTATVTITLNDLNDAPTVQAVALSVPENSTNGLSVGNVPASDPDATAPNNTLAWSITGGNTGGVFAINPASGELSVANGTALDFETLAAYALQVTVTDGGGLSDTAAVDISVLDVNEAPLLADAARAVPENSPAGTLVGAPLAATDPDTTAPNNTLVYAITGGNAGNAFAINAASGQLSVLTPAALVLANSPIDVLVTVTDGGSPSLGAVANVSVNITDVNDPPVFSAASYTVTLAENSALGTLVVSAPATDPDVGQLLTYSIVSGNTDGAFAIDADGDITVASVAAVDFELTPVFTLGISVSDDGTPPAGDTATVTVNLSNVNEAPTAIALSNSSVDEDAAIGTTVGLLSSTDEDAGDAHAYTLVAGAGATDNASFAIVGNALQTAALLDFESQVDYDIRIRSTDADGLWVEQTFSVVSIDANEPPTLITLSGNTVAENAAIGTAVGGLSSTDPDAGDTHTYSLVAGSGDADNGSFAIVGSSLRTNAVFDFETRINYSVRIRSTDAAGLTLEQEFALLVTDVNEAPAAPQLDNSTLAENQPAGTLVGNLSAVDPDAGDTLTYALVAGAGDTDNGVFQIVGTQLQTSAVLDFETRAVYSVRIAVSDGSISTPAVFSITVTNVNEAPTDIILSNNSVDEDLPAGTVVGSFSSVDDDVGDSHAYTLVAGAGSADNGRFQIVSNVLQTAAVLDADSQPGYSIRVRSTDAAGLSVEVVFALIANNINEQPTALAISNASVAENQAAGTAVGTFSTIDPDTGDSFTYTLVGGAGDTGNGNFAVSGSQLVTAASFDFETAPSYSVRVRSTDSGGLFVEQVFTISVTNVNEAPTALALSASAVDENLAAGTAVGTFTTTDPDTSDTFTYTLVGGAGSGGNGSFIIAGNQLQTAAMFNFEAQPSYSIRVRSTDAGGLSVESAFTITVNDVNEAPVPQNHTFSGIGNVRLAAAPGTAPTLPVSVNVVGSLLDGATDPDGGATLSAAFVSGTAGATVVVNADGSFEYTSAPGHVGATDTFTFAVSDGALSANATVTVNLGERVWFVRNNASAGTGRSIDPFNTLAQAGTQSLPNDIIFVYAGSGTSANQNAGIVLKNGQKLYGETIGLTVSGFPALVAPGGRPVISNAAGNGVTVLAGTGNPRTGIEIRGLSLSGSGAGSNAIDVTSTGDATAVLGVRISENVITAATAEGIDINTGSAAAQTLAIHDNELTAGGTALDVQRTAVAGVVTITAFANNVVTGASGGLGISVSSNSPGMVVFDSSSIAPGTQPVSGGVTRIGVAGDHVGGGGMWLNGVAGTLEFVELHIFATSADALRVDVSGAGFTLFAPNGASTVHNIGGVAAFIVGATLDMQNVALTSTNSSTNGVVLANVVGTFSTTATSTITEAASLAFVISGGNANITYAGSITDDLGTLVQVSNTTGGLKLFSGPINDGNDGDGNGIVLTNNTGATIRFNGGLVLSTGTNPAFTATGGGTVEVCDENPCNAVGAGALVNTIATTTGTALNVANTTIGGNGLEFRSISAGTAASGPATGVVLNTTGTVGGLVVKGTGAAGTGGTIQRAGTGVSLTATRGVSLSYMQLNDFSDFAIRGQGVSNFILDTSIINGTNGNDAGADEGSVRFTELTGTALIRNSSISGAVEHTMQVINTAGLLDRLTVSGTTFGTMNTTTGSDGLLIETLGSAVINATVQGNTFTHAVGDHFQFSSNASTSSDVVFTGNTLSNASTPVSGGGGIRFVGGSNIGPINAGLTFDVQNNTIRDARGTAIAVNKLGGNGTFGGRIEGNTVGLAGVANSGSSEGSGVYFLTDNAGLYTTTVRNNQTRQYANYGIYAQTGGSGVIGTGTLNATVTGNIAAFPGTPVFGKNGAHLNGGVTAGDTYSICFDLGGAGAASNTLINSGTDGGTDYRVRQRQSTTVRLPGYAGTNGDTTAVVTYLNGRNTIGGGGGSAAANAPPGGGFISGAACPTP